MTHQSNPSNPKSSLDNTAQVEADLFNAIVKGEGVHCELKHPIDASTIQVSEQAASKIHYPWNPNTPESQDFFTAPSSASPLAAFNEAELDQQADQFFNQLDQLWNTSLQTSLSRKFATVPPSVLNTIAQQAQALCQQGDSLIDQLAECVQTAMPQWALEDLQVLARPVAYAMRGEADAADAANRDWQTLSATEQAKLSLAIAKYAIAEATKAS